MAVLQEFKCPCCDGAIAFDAGTQSMKCPYCDSEFELKDLQEYQTELDNEKQDDMTWENDGGKEWTEGETEGLRIYSCNSCGGEIVADETTGATECPFCGNPVVMTGQFAGTLKPDYVVPFKIDKKAAIAALQNHYKGKPLLPKAFKTQNHIQEVKGLYVPFWLFDTDVDASIRYRATRVQHWSDSDYDYTRTSYYSLLRSGQIAFDNVPVDGSVKMDNDLMESVEPYDMSQAVDFETAYLAGFLADKFDMSAEDCKQRANERIRSSTESYFASTAVGYATVLPEHSNVTLAGGKVRYALLPVWLLTTRYQDKLYTFAMNGQTGKMVGNLPICRRTFFTYLLGIGLGSGALISLIACLL